MNVYNSPKGSQSYYVGICKNMAAKSEEEIVKNKKSRTSDMYVLSNY